MKIAIEGMDGVGKTTIAKMLAKEYNMTYLDKPLKELFATEQSDGQDTLARVSSKIYGFDDEAVKAWFFGLGNLYSFIKYKDQDVVVDRHFASNYFWNGTPRTNTVFASMIEMIGVPDITIVLTGSVETRMQRLYARNPEDYDLTDTEKAVKGDDKMIQFLEQFNIPFVEVNTDGKDVDEVYSEVRRIVSKLTGDFGRELKQC